jgi:hypothetical protein
MTGADFATPSLMNGGAVTAGEIRIVKTVTAAAVLKSKRLVNSILPLTAMTILLSWIRMTRRNGWRHFRGR